MLLLNYFVISATIRQRHLVLTLFLQAVCRGKMTTHVMCDYKYFTPATRLTDNLG